MGPGTPSAHADIRPRGAGMTELGEAAMFYPGFAEMITIT
jgi:hypothetical protein